MRNWGFCESEHVAPRLSSCTENEKKAGEPDWDSPRFEFFDLLVCTAVQAVVELLLLFNFEASLFKGFVAEDLCNLFVALEFLDDALAFVTAERHFGAGDGDFGVLVQVAARQRALVLLGLSGRDKLSVGHSVHLLVAGLILSEGFRAAIAAEIDLTALVVGGLIGLGRLFLGDNALEAL